MTKGKNPRKSLDREEYGFGYDISPDDLDVRGQNKEAKTANDNENKAKPTNKNSPSRLNI
ncbi:MULTISPECIES: hypothetical protein [unclassified Psychrobacillus]|uniref:hypothetical protein n=1 Tax=unclassified Psychrobacillus TaxID=2636677 RepID=UPI0024998F91|nr:hypothetical protein [Psychrobacillus sp. NEAU-3TGS]MDI2586845.1 hypothetical protein [Psychrobacillus sp. NEAU-3TGS]